MSSSSPQKSDVVLPIKYQEFSDVFDKVKASKLPQHQLYDFPIDLQLVKEPVHRYAIQTYKCTSCV
jgi:hypothetical protein